jgi:glucosamine-6-phosphate deaminase
MNTDIQERHSFRAGKLNVYVFDSRRHALNAAAAAVAAETRRIITERGRVIGVFSSAPSQSEFLDELVRAEGIEWTRVIGFHLDELVGADEEAPQSHRRFLIDRLVKRVPMAEFHSLRGEAANPEAVCANYAALLKSRPPDFAALDLGEIGRLASIDSRVCDFNDPLMVKVVELDALSRRAISLTIPAIMTCPKLFLIATEEVNRGAHRAMIEGEITMSCPASILKTHEDAHMFI